MQRSVSVLLLASLAALAHATARAQGQDVDALQLSALVQEGDLLLEEALTLEPDTQQLAREAEGLAATEKAIASESKALNETVRAYNAAMNKLNDAIRAHKAQCPQQTQDRALAEACNNRAAQLRQSTRKLEDEGPQLQAQQDDLNHRIEQHNKARIAYAARKREQDAKVQANRNDLQYWLSRLNPFLHSQAFSSFVERAGSPAACGAARIGSVQVPTSAAVKRVQECLKAVRPS
jgi:chromosome segregation ATPase